jgi:hypothetical protein
MHFQRPVVERKRDTEEHALEYRFWIPKNFMDAEFGGLEFMY